MSNNPTPVGFWAKNWARMVLNRVNNETWQSVYTVPEEYAHNRCFNIELLRRATGNEDLAFDVFEHDFSRLRPDLQLALAGALRSAWLEADRKRRYGSCQSCAKTNGGAQ